MAEVKQDRKKEILEAARAEFIREGVSGARMQAIADNIGVTKAMIHYYFKSKENLFKEVFRQASETLIHGLMDVLEQDAPLFQKIEAFIDGAMDRFSQHPELAGFVISELERHPDNTVELFLEVQVYDASAFYSQLEQAASNYEIAPVEGPQVVANMLSLCLFPFAGQAFLQQMVAGAEKENYRPFLDRRREVIKDTIINWLAG